MSPGEHDATLRRFEARTKTEETAQYVLTLFVTGSSDMSARAIRSVRAICDQHLTGRHQLEVIDVHRDASLMSAHDVVAAPTLIKESPLPKRMLVGDLSDTPRVLAALDIAALDATLAAPPVTAD